LEQADIPGAREQSSGIRLACRHLPPSLLSAPGQRTAMLQDAIETMERLGDKRGARECQKMLLDSVTLLTPIASP